MKHNAELSVTVNIFTGILTKQLIIKAERYLKLVNELQIKDKMILEDFKEDVSDMSKGSTNEPHICFYSYVINAKGKLCKKSRRCVIYQKLTVVYCGYCTKAYCYVISGKKHNRTCLVDHIKEMKRKNS